MAQETTAYYAFGVPLYLGVLALEARRARARGLETLRLAESLGNISAGLGTIVIGLFLGPALLALYGFGLRHLALVSWQPGAWQPWLLAWVLADFGHYWHHRVDHRIAACWAVHGVHHQPEHMNFSVAMRHAWFSDLYSFPFYVPLVVCGVPAECFFVATTLLSFHALITHTEVFDFPSFGVLVTPRSHTLHHARNAPYLDRNFGAMLCIWDRLFGTYVGHDPARPPEYGALDGYETHDGVLSQWVLWRNLLKRLRHAKTARQWLITAFGRPTPRQAHAAERALPISAVVSPPHELSPRTRGYVLVQFALTLCFAIGVCLGRDEASLAFRLVTCGVVLIGLWAIGGLLDQRRHASRIELIRLAASVAAVLLAWRLGTP